MEKRTKVDIARENWYKTDCEGLSTSVIKDAYVRGFNRAYKLMNKKAIKPIKHYIPDGNRTVAAWECGECLIDIGYGVNYCYNCGRKVDWE